MKKIIFPDLMFFFIIVLMVGCAGIHNDKYAYKSDSSGNIIMEENAKFIISGELDEYSLTEYFGLLNFTFENKSDKWVRIENIRIYFNSEEADENVIVTAADDIVAWQEAMDYQLAVDDYNSAMGHAVIAGFGQGLAESDNEAVSELGDFITLASIGSLTIKSLDRYKGEIENANIFPESHLLANKFSVPPGLFAKKWILLNTSDSTPYISSINLELTFDTGEKQVYKLNFRNPVPQNGAKWQSKQYKYFEYKAYSEP